MQKSAIVLIPELKIQNIVCTADLKQRVDIASFNEFEFLRSNLDLYRCGYVKDNTMVGRTTVFASGKLISVGTKSIEQSINELKKTCKILQKYKLVKLIKIIPKVQNIVAKFDLEKKIQIEKLARTVPKCMYEPDQFPGLIFHIKDGCTIMIFASGKGIITGAKTISDLNQGMYQLKSWINQ